MAFKLKSGNKTPFKAMGERKGEDNWKVDELSRRDSLNIYDKQKELNLLADKYNKSVEDNTFVYTTEEDGVQRSTKNPDGSGVGDNKLDQKLQAEFYKQRIDAYTKFKKEFPFEENPYTLAPTGNPDFYDSDANIAEGTQTWGQNKFDAEKWKPKNRSRLFPQFYDDLVTIESLKAKLIETPEDAHVVLKKAGMDIDTEKYKYQYGWNKKQGNVIKVVEKKIINGVRSNFGAGKVVSVDPAWMYGTVAERRKKFK